MRVILGSSSKYRQQILREMGYEFEVLAPAIDEKSIRRPDPVELVRLLAEVKAEAVLAAAGPGPVLVITADQVVTHAGTIREKPSDPEEARHFLRTSSDVPTETVSAVCVTNTATGKRATGVDVVRIHLRPLPATLIERIVERGDVLHCAGGLRVEDPLIQPYVARIEGDLDSVMGLPKTLTRRLIAEVSGP